MKNLGIVLFTTLVFLMILMLLGLAMAESSLMESRMSLKQLRWQQAFDAAEIGLKSIEEKINLSSECVIPITSSAALLLQALSWWQASESCTGKINQFQYYYVIESLGVDTCASFENLKNKVADYFRITLLLVPEKSENLQVMVQSTTVEPVETKIICDRSTRVVMLGRQSWRML